MREIARHDPDARVVDAATDSWRSRAADAIPGGTSTGSKRPEALYGSHAQDESLPTHYERAHGCTVFTPDGKSYLDCTMALGAVALGYADEAVTRAVQEAAAAGSVAGLPHRLEVEVAERLIDVVPSAEQVRFLRTGAEATAAAIRLARTSTGRQRVIACGYFGWLDWCSDSEGVLPAERETVRWVPFNDVLQLEAALSEEGDAIAAVIIEPLVHDIASREWLLAARRGCDRCGAVLIFDEIKTGFRIRTGGVQELHDVVPDLTTLGKALANGYPLSALVGRAGIMDCARKTWISSTAAAESTGLAAARAVLDWHERVDVPARLASIGTAMRDVVVSALHEAEWLQLQALGPSPMWRIEPMGADTKLLDAFVAAAAHAGVLLKRGAYQFPALAHEKGAVELLATAMNAACRELEASEQL